MSEKKKELPTNPWVDRSIQTIEKEAKKVEMLSDNQSITEIKKVRKD